MYEFAPSHNGDYNLVAEHLLHSEARYMAIGKVAGAERIYISQRCMLPSFVNVRYLLE